MAEATITIKLSPQEFDLAREAIQSAITEVNETVADMSAHASDRQKARARLLRLQDLSKRLGG